MAAPTTAMDVLKTAWYTYGNRRTAMNSGRCCLGFCGLLHITLLVVGILAACQVLTMSNYGIATCILIGISPLLSPIFSACTYGAISYKFLFDD